MVEAQGNAVEGALWAALEILEERGELLRRIAVRMDARARQRFRDGARDADERAAVIRRVLSRRGQPRVSQAADDAAFEALLEFLKGTRGVDFTGYKRPSLAAPLPAPDGRPSAASRSATISTTSRSPRASTSSSSRRC